MGGMGCCIQVLGSRDSAFRAGLCWMLPNMVMVVVVVVVVTEGTLCHCSSCDLSDLTVLLLRLVNSV